MIACEKASEQVHESGFKDVKNGICLHAVSKHRALVGIIERTGEGAAKRREVGE